MNALLKIILPSALLTLLGTGFAFGAESDFNNIAMALASNKAHHNSRLFLNFGGLTPSILYFLAFLIWNNSIFYTLFPRCNAAGAYSFWGFIGRSIRRYFVFLGFLLFVSSSFVLFDLSDLTYPRHNVPQSAYFAFFIPLFLFVIHFLYRTFYKKDSFREYLYISFFTEPLKIIATLLPSIMIFYGALIVIPSLLFTDADENAFLLGLGIFFGLYSLLPFAIPLLSKTKETYKPRYRDLFGSFFLMICIGGLPALFVAIFPHV